MPWIDKPCMCNNIITWHPTKGKYWCQNKEVHPSNEEVEF